MTKLLALASIVSAVLAVSVKVDYDRDQDELTIRLRKVRPLLGVLKVTA